MEEEVNEQVEEEEVEEETEEKESCLAVSRFVLFLCRIPCTQVLVFTFYLPFLFFL